MRKFEKLFVELATLRGNLRGDNSLLAKAVIGDSVNNNRTLTVKQTIRFLYWTGQFDLAHNLLIVSSILEPVILKQRKVSRNRRTDAVDISEFITAYRSEVMNKGLLRREIGNSLRTTNVG